MDFHIDLPPKPPNSQQQHCTQVWSKSLHNGGPRPSHQRCGHEKAHHLPSERRPPAISLLLPPPLCPPLLPRSPLADNDRYILHLDEHQEPRWQETHDTHHAAYEELRRGANKVGGDGPRGTGGFGHQQYQNHGVRASSEACARHCVWAVCNDVHLLPYQTQDRAWNVVLRYCTTMVSRWSRGVSLDGEFGVFADVGHPRI